MPVPDYAVEVISDSATQTILPNIATGNSTVEVLVQGPPGVSGTNGTPGSIWRSGSGAPNTSIGVVGDWYIDTVAAVYYEKTGTSTYTSRGTFGTSSGGGATLADLRTADANAFYSSTTSSYPTRSSVTSDTQRRVRWIGPNAPTIGGLYAINGFDIWEQT